MSKLSKLKIKTGDTISDTEVFLNGENITKNRKLAKLEIILEAGDYPKAVLYYDLDEVEFEGEAVIEEYNFPDNPKGGNK